MNKAIKIQIKNELVITQFGIQIEISRPFWGFHNED